MVFVLYPSFGETDDQMQNEAAERKLVLSGKLCSNRPSHFSFDSSHKGFMGIGGTPGKACPRAEMFFVHGDYFGVACFKAKGGKPIELGSGLGIFSPDCKHLWFESAGEISIRDGLTGDEVQKIKGEDATWLPDSGGILYTAIFKGTLSLKRWTFQEKAEQVVHEFTDYQSCQAPGEGILYLPAVIRGHKVSFKYPVAGKVSSPDGSDYRKAKSVIFEFPSYKILSSKDDKLECE